jgi:probable rRNA maturation factor
MTVRISGLPTVACSRRIDLKLLGSRARRALAALGHRSSELSLSLVDDAEIQELNRTWRGIDRPTDVLSFSLVEGDCELHRGSLLGDVVIGVEIAARQARNRHRAYDEELARLLIHGLLHLLGHDHEADAEYREMRAEERRLWQICRS